MTGMTQVTKNIDEKRFELEKDGEVVGYADYIVGEGVVTLPHTFVEPSQRGHGIADQLVQAALDDIRSGGYRVEPQCSYVRAWIDRHPDYADLVAKPAGDDLAQAEEDAAEVIGLDVDSDPRI